MNLDGLHAFVVLAALLVRAVLPAYDAHARASADAAAGADLRAARRRARDRSRPHPGCARHVDVLRASARFIFGDLLGNTTADAILRALRKAGASGQTRIRGPEATKGDGQFSFEADAFGILAQAGYRVGATRGEPEAARLRTLARLFQQQITAAPPGGEWGRPSSARRLQKLANTIATLTPQETRATDGASSGRLGGRLEVPARHFLRRQVRFSMTEYSPRRHKQMKAVELELSGEKTPRTLQRLPCPTPAP